MLRTLRRLRPLLLALLFATPGVGGNLLQAVHACPVEAPWLSPDSPSGAHHHGQPDPEQDRPAGCHCIGACHTASSWVAPAGRPTVALAVPAPAAERLPADFTAAPVARPDRFLPPATAPPLG